MLHLAPLSNWTAVVDGAPVSLFPPTLQLAGIEVWAPPAVWGAARPDGAIAAPGRPLDSLAAAVLAGVDDGSYVLPL